MVAQVGNGQVGAAAAAGGHAQGVLQVGKAGGSGGNRFFDLAVGNGITNTNKHECAP